MIPKFDIKSPTCQQCAAIIFKSLKPNSFPSEKPQNDLRAAHPWKRRHVRGVSHVLRRRYDLRRSLPCHYLYGPPWRPHERAEHPRSPRQGRRPLRRMDEPAASANPLSYGTKDNRYICCCRPSHSPFSRAGQGHNNSNPHAALCKRGQPRAANPLSSDDSAVHRSLRFLQHPAKAHSRCVSISTCQIYQKKKTQKRS
jgi:hypothetical protein